MTIILLLGLRGVALVVPSGAYAGRGPRQINPSAIQLEPGDRVEAVIANLSMPTTTLFDGSDLLIAESGWEDTAQPRILRVKPNGTVSTVVSDGLLWPVTGLRLGKGPPICLA